MKDKNDSKGYSSPNQKDTVKSKPNNEKKIRPALDSDRSMGVRMEDSQGGSGKQISSDEIRFQASKQREELYQKLMSSTKEVWTEQEILEAYNNYHSEDRGTVLKGNLTDNVREEIPPVSEAPYGSYGSRMNTDAESQHRNSVGYTATELFERPKHGSVSYQPSNEQSMQQNVGVNPVPESMAEDAYKARLERTEPVGADTYQYQDASDVTQQPAFYKDWEGNYYDPHTHAVLYTADSGTHPENSGSVSPDTMDGRQTFEPVYQGRDGAFYSGEQAVQAGIVTRQQLEEQQSFFSSHAGHGQIQQQTMATGNTAEDIRLMQLRRENGFGDTSDTFQQDDAYRSMMEIARQEGQEFPSGDAAFAQSRFFQQNLSEGMDKNEAYHSAAQEYVRLVSEGHTPESAVATLNNRDSSEIEYLRQSRTNLEHKTDDFSLRQEEKWRPGVQGSYPIHEGKLQDGQPIQYFTDPYGWHYDSKTHEPVYLGKDGTIYSADQAVQAGIVTRQEMDREKIFSENTRYPSGQGYAQTMGHTTEDIRLMQLRRENGFGETAGSFVPDSAYRSMMEIAKQEGQEFPSGDAAFAQSRFYQQNLSDGMNKNEAYHSAEKEYTRLVSEGHTPESAVAILNNRDSKEIEFLRQSGTRLERQNDAFSFGQYAGEQAPLQGAYRFDEGTLKDGNRVRYFTDQRGQHFDADTFEPVFKGNDGSLYRGEQAVQAGIVTRQQLDVERVSIPSRSQFMNDGGVQKQTLPTGLTSEEIRFMQLRRENGFGSTVGSFAHDSAYRSMMEIAKQEGQEFPSGDAAFAQSRFFQKNLSQGMGKADAYDAAVKEYSRLASEGHSPESAVATLLGKDSKDVEFLRQSGTRLDRQSPAFSLGLDTGRQMFLQKSYRLSEGTLHDGKHIRYFTDQDGRHFEALTLKPMYMDKEGVLYHQDQAIQAGVVTREQVTSDCVGLAQPRDALSMLRFRSAIQPTKPTNDKIRLIRLRDEIGFGASTSGFIPDHAYHSMMEIAKREGQEFPSMDAAFAQSRLFQIRLMNGLDKEQAYLEAVKDYKLFASEGHTAESVVASLKGLKPEDIDFLKQNGWELNRAEGGFTVGQRSGRKASTGRTVNPDVSITAMRLKKWEAQKNTKGKKDAVSDIKSGSVAKNPAIVRHNLYHPTGRVAAIAQGTKGLAMGVSMIGLTLFYSGAGESASGLRKMQDAVEFARLTVGVSILNIARRTLNHPLARELDGMLHFYGAKDILSYRRSLNKQLAALGIKPYPTSLSGPALTRAAQLQILSLKKQIATRGMTPGLKQALSIAKQYRKLGLLTTFAKTPRRAKLGRRMVRLGSIGLRKILSIDQEAFGGIDLISRYAQSAMMAARAFLWAGQKTALLGMRAAGGVINMTGKAAAKAGSAMMKSGIAEVSSAGRLLQGYSRGVKRAGAFKRQSGRQISHIRERVSSFRRDPFGIKAKTKRQIDRIINKLASRFKIIGRLQKVSSAISKVSAVISTVVGGLVQALFFLGGMILLLFVFLIILSSVITGIVGIFDFSAYDDTVQDIIVSRVEERYQEDYQKMLDISHGYDQSSIQYDDTFKDDEKYTEYKSEAEAESFLQSTNCAEIIAMTCVRFGYDVDDIAEEDDVSWGQKRDIENYIDELYYGSHEIYVDESISTYQSDTGEVDEDGNPIMETKTRRTAIFTYRSYYFEYLFDDSMVSLGRSETPVIYKNTGSGGAYGYITNEDSIYAFLRDAGFSHAATCGIMGNIQQESSFNPNNGTGSYYGICQWGGSGLEALKDYCIDNGLDYTTATGQLNFLVADIENNLGGMNYNRLEELLKGDEYADDPKACASFFCMAYERCVGGSDPYEYWDVYSIYSSGTRYLYQELDERIQYARQFYNTYSAYAEDWSDLVNDGQAIVDYALQYIGRIHYTQGTSGYTGTRYIGPDLDKAVYSGSGTPTIGTDCSGFIASAYKHFGITVPTSSGEYQSQSVHEVSMDEIQPGDILWRSGHVALYIGNGQVAQMSRCNGGDHSTDGNIRDISSLSGQYAFKKAYRFWE